MKKVFSFPGFRFRNEYFLFLLPLFFVAHGYTDHYGEVPAKDALFLVVEYVGYILLTTIVLGLIFRSVRKASVFTLVFFSYFFFFGAVHDWLKNIGRDTFLPSYSFLLPFSAATFLLFGYYLVRANSGFNRLTRYLNTLLLVLLAIDCFIMAFKIGDAKALDTNNNVSEFIVQSPLCDTCKGEDIHLILTDEYAGSQSLKEALQFDNRPFEDSLRSRGFHVVDNPRSNYNYTVASMASLLNMDYLPDLSNLQDKEIYHISKQLINKNTFTSFLTDRGYTIRNFSIFTFADQPPFTEPYFPQHIKLITGNTLSSRVKKDIGYHAALTFKIGSSVERVKKEARQSAEIESRKMDSVIKEVAFVKREPRFFYTHLIMPHAPYDFDKNGNLQSLELLLDPKIKRTESELYLQYLQYANKKLLYFVDEIIRRSARPPIILLMSDHGYRRKNIAIPYHFNTINAVYFPNGVSKGFYPGLSNVNQLRILLNKKFDQKLPMLPDSSIYLESNGPSSTLWEPAVILNK
jgi:hypothetical protein